MAAEDLVFTHRDDPDAQITCSVEGAANVFGAQPMPIVRCRLTGAGSAEASRFLIPQGVYFTPDHGFELNCDSTVDNTCMLSLNVARGGQDPFADGMLVLGDCADVCSTLGASSRCDPVATTTSSSLGALASPDPMLRDSAGSASRSGSIASSPAPVCMVTFLGRTPQRVPVLAVGSGTAR
jgi:hypothetical protein